MPSLLDFPNEILLQIADNLHRSNDLSSLLRANSFFATLLNPLLRELALLEPDPRVPTICWAARQGHEPLVKLLLAGGTVIETWDDEQKKSPLQWAAGRGHKEVVRMLLEQGAEIEEMDDDGKTPLIDAVCNDNIGVARLLLDKGANPDCRDSRIMSFERSWGNNANVPGAALHHACRRNPPNLSMVEMLLEKGADVDITDMRGNTALHVAVEGMDSSQGRRALVKILLGAGADMDLFNRNLDTVLHMAVLQGDRNLVKLLVENGADRCRPNSGLNIPLHLAVEQDMTAITKILLQDVTDAEMAYKNTSNKTPMHLALEKLLPPMVKLFVDHFAKDGRVTNFKVW